MPFTVKTENEKLISIDASGELSPENIDEGLDRLLTLTEKYEDASVLIRLSNMDLGSLQEVSHKVARRPEYLELKGRAARAAILTDQPWIKASATVETSVMPRLDAKVYDLADEVDALVWLEKRPEHEAA